VLAGQIADNTSRPETGSRDTADVITSGGRASPNSPKPEDDEAGK